MLKWKVILTLSNIYDLLQSLYQRSLKNVDRTSADSGDWIFHFWVKTDRFDKYLYFVVQLILTVQAELFEVLCGVLTLFHTACREFGVARGGALSARSMVTPSCVQNGSV